MKTADYWAERFTQLEAAQNAAAAASLPGIEKLYRDAQKDLEAKIAVWYQRFADNNEISLADARKWLTGKDLEEFHWDVKDYIKYGKQNAVDGQWVKQLENASAKWHISRFEALKIQTQQSFEALAAKYNSKVKDIMSETFRTGYYHTAFELQKGVGIGFDVASLNQNVVEAILSKPWAADEKNFSSRIWENKQKLIDTAHKELTHNMMLGQDPQKAIDAISKNMQVAKGQAGRLVMTEEAYFSSAAQKKAFSDLGVEKYEIVATLDSHTSEICRELDGKVFDMKDYRPGETAPPFHVWCRTTTAPYFEDDFGSIGERAAKDEEGKTYYIPAGIKYPEWKKAMVDGDKTALQEVRTIVDHNFGGRYNNTRTVGELQSVAQEIKAAIPSYTDKKSKWSGKIKINNSLAFDGTLGQKEWNCDIALVDSVDNGIVWHEMLHSCSASHYDPQTYLHNQFIEEASVEFLKQQICKENHITSITAYNDLTLVLQVLNGKFNYGSDMEFAKELFNIPLPDRYLWLENKVDESLRHLNASFEDYNDVMAFIKKLKGGA